jgi:polyhydroxybutyrate depolymerase
MRSLADTAIVVINFLSRAIARPDNPVRSAIRKTVVVDGLKRHYLVFVPAGPRESMPVALVFHAGGGSARRMERRTRFNELAAKEGFLVIYPEAIDGNWNDGRGCQLIRAQRENIDDVKFARCLLDQVAGECRIDRRRVFATGASNGAMMSHRLAAEASDVIAGIAPVIGGMAQAIADAFKPEFPVSILVIQGDSDPVVPIDGGDVVADGGRKRGQIISTSELLAKYTERNGSQGEPVRSTLDADLSDGTSVEIAKYPEGPGGVKTCFYLVKNWGHAWPGRPLSLLDSWLRVACRDFSATDVIWEFFKNCPPRLIPPKRA